MQLARAPAGISPVEAAALPLAALTAWQCLMDAAGLRPGAAVLVHGASGGVGHLAVQLAAGRGARVASTVGRQDRDPLEMRDADVALDLVGGSDTLQLLRTVHEGGVLLAVADGAGDDVKAEAARRRIRVLEPLVEPDGRALDEIAKLVEAGTLKVAVGGTFPLEQAAEAHRRLEAGGVKGKLVLEVADHD